MCVFTSKSARNEMKTTKTLYAKKASVQATFEESKKKGETFFKGLRPFFGANVNNLLSDALELLRF